MIFRPPISHTYIGLQLHLVVLTLQYMLLLEIQIGGSTASSPWGSNEPPGLAKNKKLYIKFLIFLTPKIKF